MKEASSSISYASEGERRERRAKAFVDTKYALSVAHARKTFTIFHLGARAVALSCSCSSGRRLKAETSTRKSGRETRTRLAVDGIGRGKKSYGLERNIIRLCDLSFRKEISQFKPDKVYND